MATPQTLVETYIRILPEWIDLDGQMKVACYVLALDRANDTLCQILDIAGNCRERRSASFADPYPDAPSRDDIGARRPATARTPGSPPRDATE